MSQIYDSIVNSRNGMQVPVFTSGRAMHSKYDPAHEAENFAKETSSEYAVILGIGGAYHIKAFLERNPKCMVIAVEKNREDMDLLQQITCVKEVINDKRVETVFPDNLEQKITETYFPALYGNLSILPQRMWLNENKNLAEGLIGKINDTLKKISSDFSVQAHFGKLWLKNIFSNLHTISKANSKSVTNISASGDTQKTAAIIAAGPTVDETIKKIIARRNEYYVIATDTATGILREYGIIPDTAVSIDAQWLSSTHYIGEKNKGTFFINDMAGSPSAAALLKRKSYNVIFCRTGHPLSEFASQYFSNPPILLTAGSGTVTIAAADLALKAGFSKIEIYGADFAYSNGKAYAKGTYLEHLYRKDESRLENAETKFDRLLFRTELEEKEKAVYSNDVLESYRKTLIQWIESNGMSWVKENDCYIIESCGKYRKTAACIEFFDKAGFIRGLKNELGEAVNAAGNPEFQKKYLTGMNGIKILLPYLAWLEKKSALDPSKDFSKILNLAYSKILMYTELL